MSTKTSKVMSLKVHFENEIRRWSMPLNSSYNELCEILNKLFEIDVRDRTQYSLKYKDDEDEFVVFTTDLELREAMRFATTTDRPLLRLFIVKVTKTKTKKTIRTIPKRNQQMNSCFQRRRGRCCHPFNFMKMNPMFMLTPKLKNSFKDLKGIDKRIEKLIQNKKVVDWFKVSLPRLGEILESLIDNGAIEIETVLVQIQSLLEESKLPQEIQTEITNLSTLLINKIVQMKEIITDLPIVQMIKSFFGTGKGKSQLPFPFPFPFPMEGMFGTMMKGMFPNPQKNCFFRTKLGKNGGFTFHKHFEKEKENKKEKEKEKEIEKETEKEKEIEIQIDQENENEMENEMENEKKNDIQIEQEEKDENKESNEINFTPLEEIEEFFEVKENEVKETKENVLQKEIEYANEMEQLIGIGLVDLELNTKLLKKFKGNVRRVANAILNGRY
ncbi:protein clmp1 [Anaeramoeba flamelloides]|uniref:Protein clmp1 n=1 Tax=Anaeramoeba flamelloides TaxID=1746091 RepID=A0ABQ8XXF3_9EUKA|nr:protein clmp1 [Anaeramoeba flamelloides]